MDDEIKRTCEICQDQVQNKFRAYVFFDRTLFYCSAHGGEIISNHLTDTLPRLREEYYLRKQSENFG